MLKKDIQILKNPMETDKPNHFAIWWKYHRKKSLKSRNYDLKTANMDIRHMQK